MLPDHTDTTTQTKASLKAIEILPSGEKGTWLVHCFSPKVCANCVQLTTTSPDDTASNVFI